MMFDFRNDSPPTPTADEKIAALRADLDSMNTIYARSESRVTALHRKIQNVRDYITEVYLETDLVPDSLAEIAKMLDIRLTKPVSGEATFTISWTAQVPLDFDPDDLEISFSVDCEDDVEDFEWVEESTDAYGREGY